MLCIFKLVYYKKTHSRNKKTQGVKFLPVLRFSVSACFSAFHPKTLVLRCLTRLHWEAK